MSEDELRTQILCEMRAASKVFIGEELLDHLTDIALRHVRESRQQEGAFDTQGATTETP